MQETRNVTIDGRRTSLCLEAAFWDALGDMARREECSIDRIVAQALRAAEPDAVRSGRRAAAVRVFTAEYFLRRTHTKFHR